VVELEISSVWVVGLVGVAGVAGLFIALWLALKAVKTVLFWGALGGIPMFRIFSESFEMLINGAAVSEVVGKMGFYVIFFLKSLDSLISNPPYGWVVFPVVVLLGIWLILCLGFASTLATEWVHIGQIWAFPIGVGIWYVLTGALEGVRGLVVNHVPALDPVLTPFYGIYLIFIIFAATVLTCIIHWWWLGRGL